MAKTQRMRVTYTDGREVEALAGPKAQVMLERKFGRSLSAIAHDEGAEPAYYLAWAAATCAQLETRDFEQFLAVIDTIEVVGEQGADPTDPAPSPDTSSS